MKKNPRVRASPAKELSQIIRTNEINREEIIDAAVARFQDVFLRNNPPQSKQLSKTREARLNMLLPKQPKGIRIFTEHRMRVSLSKRNPITMRRIAILKN